jgi:hypothetical protein
VEREGKRRIAWVIDHGLTHEQIGEDPAARGVSGGPRQLHLRWLSRAPQENAFAKNGTGIGARSQIGAVNNITLIVERTRFEVVDVITAARG